MINCWAERGSLNRVLGIGMQITNDAVPWITGILSAIEYCEAPDLVHHSSLHNPGLPENLAFVQRGSVADLHFPLA